MGNWNASEQANELLDKADDVISATRSVEKADAYQALHDAWFGANCEERRAVAYELDGNKIDSRKYNGDLSARFEYDKGELTALHFDWSKSSSMGGLGTAHLTDNVTLSDPFDGCTFW
jgi:hypothetical protein